MTISCEMRNKIAEYYKEGYSMRNTAMVFDVGKSTVANILKEKGIEIRNKRNSIPEKEVEEIYNRVLNGELVKKIAEEKYVTPSAISHLLRRRNYRR